MLERDALEVVPTLQGADLGLRQDLDARVDLDAVDQVPRHVGTQIRASNGEGDVAALLGEVDGGLSRGVAAADHDDVVAAADPGLELRGRVVETGSFEPLEAVDGKAPVPGAGGDDDGPAGDLALVGEDDDVEALLETERDRLGRAGEQCSEPLGLDGGASGQLPPGDAAGKAGVVLDARAGARLPPWPDCVQADGVEALRRTVHRRCEARGAGSHNDEVEHPSRYRLVGEAEFRGEVRRGRMAEDGGRRHDDGRVDGSEPHAVQHGVDVVGVVEVDPRVAQPGPGGKRPQGHRVG